MPQKKSSLNITKSKTKDSSKKTSATKETVAKKTTLIQICEELGIKPEIFSKSFADFMSRNIQKNSTKCNNNLLNKENHIKTIQAIIADFNKTSNRSIFADSVPNIQKQKFIALYEKSTAQMLSNIKDAGKIDELFFNSLLETNVLKERPLFYSSFEENEELVAREGHTHSVEFLYKDATPEQMFNLDKHPTPGNKNFNKPFNINHFFDVPFAVKSEWHPHSVNIVADALNSKPNLKNIEEWMADRDNYMEIFRIYKTQRPTNEIETAILTIITERIKIRIANAVFDALNNGESKINSEEFLKNSDNFRIPVIRNESNVLRHKKEKLNTNSLTPEQINEYYLLFQKKNLSESKIEIANQEKDFNEKLHALSQVQSSSFNFNELIEYLRSQGMLERVLLAFAENPKDDLQTVMKKFEKMTPQQKQSLFFGVSSKVSAANFEKKVHTVADKVFFEKAVKNTNQEDLLFLNSPFPASTQIQIKFLFKQCDNFRAKRAEYMKGINASSGSKDDIFTKPVVQLYFKLEKEWKELLTSGDAKRIKEKYNSMVAETEKFLDGRDYNKKHINSNFGLKIFSVEQTAQDKNSFFSKAKQLWKSEPIKVNWSAHKENIFTSTPVTEIDRFEEVTAGKYKCFLKPSDFIQGFADIRTLRAYLERRKPIAHLLSKKDMFYGTYDDRARMELEVKILGDPMYNLMANKQFQNYQKNSWVLSVAPYDLKKEPKGTHLVHTEDWYEDFIEFISNRENLDLYKVEITSNESGFLFDKLDAASATKLVNWFKTNNIPAPMVVETTAETIENGVKTSQKLFSIGPIEAFNPNKEPQNKFKQTTVPYPFAKPSFTERDLIDIIAFKKTQLPMICPVFDANVEMKTFTLSKLASLEELKTMFNYDEATGKYYPIANPIFDWMSITKSFFVARKKSKPQAQKYPNEPSSAMSSNTLDFRDPAVVNEFLTDMDVALTLFNNGSYPWEQKCFEQTIETESLMFDVITNCGNRSLFSFETNQAFQTNEQFINWIAPFRMARIFSGE